MGKIQWDFFSEWRKYLLFLWDEVINKAFTSFSNWMISFVLHFNELIEIIVLVTHFKRSMILWQLYKSCITKIREERQVGVGWTSFRMEKWTTSGQFHQHSMSSFCAQRWFFINCYFQLMKKIQNYKNIFIDMLVDNQFLRKNISFLDIFCVVKYNLTLKNDFSPYFGKI